MILLDTNIIIDLIGGGEHHGAQWSRRTYERFTEAEQFGCNLIVVAELAAEGAPANEVFRRFDTFRIEVLELDVEGAFAAGRAHRAYRKRGGARTAILADFLIAGHAEALGAPLMTRDRRLGTYFPNLPLITPETHP